MGTSSVEPRQAVQRTPRPAQQAGGRRVLQRREPPARRYAKLTFNETGTSTIEIQAKDEAGAERAINTETLSIVTAEDADFDSDVRHRHDARRPVGRPRHPAFAGVELRFEPVDRREPHRLHESMINTLQTGADSLVLAEIVEEAANMLALQNRRGAVSTACRFRPGRPGGSPPF